MAARTGVARLALATGVPVIPVAHWGTQDILPYGEKKPRLLPRKTVHVVAGCPVDLSQWAGQQHSAKALRTATDAIMTQVAELVGQLRGETPPPVPYDPRNPAANQARPAQGHPSGRDACHRTSVSRFTWDGTCAISAMSVGDDISVA
jgi:hypothetical protein